MSMTIITGLETYTCSVCGTEVPSDTITMWEMDPDLAYARTTGPNWLCETCVEDMAKACDTCGELVLPGIPSAIPSAGDGTDGPWVCEGCAVGCDECGLILSPSVATAVDGDDAAPWLCPTCAEPEQD